MEVGVKKPSLNPELLLTSSMISRGRDQKFHNLVANESLKLVMLTMVTALMTTFYSQCAYKDKNSRTGRSFS